MSERELQLSVRELVEFVLRSGSIDSRYTGMDRALEGARIHRMLQKQAGSNYKAEVTLRGKRTVQGITYCLDGRADGIITAESGVILDEIKSTATPTEALHAEYSTVHWAQAQCYAAFYCDDMGLSEITVQLTYYQIDTQEVVRFQKHFTASALEDFLQDTLELYHKWAKLETDWRTQRNASLQTLAFPFTDYRAGQYRLAGAVYKTIENEGQLFACAPTGIGKTISTLYPALKALGEGHGQRIFYLTAKTITRTAAQNTLQLLRETASDLSIKNVTFTAKDKVCFLEKRDCTPDACPYANGYFDRINEVLYSLLQTESNFTRETIAAAAREHTLCPFELALDLSNFCDCIVCDYNYLFDPVVQLKRFFSGESAHRQENIFLIDEAHNLVDRSREMYSATLEKSMVYAMKKALGKNGGKLSKALHKLNQALIELRHECNEAGSTHLLLEKGSKPLAQVTAQCCTALQEWLEENKNHALSAEMLVLFFEARFFMRIWEFYDEHYTTLISLSGSNVCVQLLCLDASPFLQHCMKQGRASILFSATLTPFPYFMQTLGAQEEAKRLLLESPFETKNFCFLTAPYLSTKYLHREQTLPEVCKLIHQFVRVKNGNYIAFFPSYAYLKQAATYYQDAYPEMEILIQPQGSNEDEKEQFLAQFAMPHSQSLLAFCVLGGIFSEGIDLVGEQLIGSVIVGVGLPQINVVQDCIKEYYTQTLGEGFAYAYQYPGMNKVLQAAGRVIRTESDKGAVLLIDSRYGSYRYQTLFPPHWAHGLQIENGAQLQQILEDFWHT